VTSPSSPTLDYVEERWGIPLFYFDDGIRLGQDLRRNGRLVRFSSCPDRRSTPSTLRRTWTSRRNGSKSTNRPARRGAAMASPSEQLTTEERLVNAVRHASAYLAREAEELADAVDDASTREVCDAVGGFLGGVCIGDLVHAYGALQDHLTNDDGNGEVNE
jgi:hypothetical protein